MVFCNRDEAGAVHRVDMMRSERLRDNPHEPRKRNCFARSRRPGRHDRSGRISSASGRGSDDQAAVQTGMKDQFDDRLMPFNEAADLLKRIAVIDRYPGRDRLADPHDFREGLQVRTVRADVDRESALDTSPINSRCPDALSARRRRYRVYPPIFAQAHRASP